MANIKNQTGPFRVVIMAVGKKKDNNISVKLAMAQDLLTPEDIAAGKGDSSPMLRNTFMRDAETGAVLPATKWDPVKKENVPDPDPNHHQFNNWIQMKYNDYKTLDKMAKTAELPDGKRTMPVVNIGGFQTMNLDSKRKDGTINYNENGTKVVDTFLAPDVSKGVTTPDVAFDSEKHFANIKAAAEVAKAAENTGAENKGAEASTPAKSARKSSKVKSAEKSAEAQLGE